MKKLLTILLAGLLIAAVTAPALAWEFSMKGEWEYRLRYIGRTGDADLLGRQTKLGEVGFSGPNIYGTFNPSVERGRGCQPCPRWPYPETIP